MKAGRGCELCENGEAGAALYCPSDSAFLCWDCDSKVHQANFLVARHLRSPLCCKCKGLIITDNPISGAGFQPFHPICRFCSSQRDYISSPDDDLQYSLSSSPSSGCISYAESSSNITPPKRSADFNRFEKDKIVSSISVTELCSSSNSTISSSSKKGKSGRESRRRNSVKVDSKAEKEEGVLVSWCRKLGLSNSMICGVVVPVAVEAFGLCSKEYMRRVLPWRRVCLTASLWFSLRLCGDKSASTWQVLKRLEQISGVPAKLMFAAEAKMASVLGRRRRSRSGCHQLVEGWAETTQ